MVPCLEVVPTFPETTLTLNSKVLLYPFVGGICVHADKPVMWQHHVSSLCWGISKASFHSFVV